MAEEKEQNKEQEVQDPVKCALQESGIPIADDDSINKKKEEGQDAGDVPAGAYIGPSGKEEIMAAIEAILFAMGDSVEITALAKALTCTVSDVKDAIASLEKRYEKNDSGIMIQRFDDAVQMSTKASQYVNLIRIAKVPRKMTLSDSVIETLSIIAYRQPITKAEIEQIRGVASDYAINRLLSYDLIRELGRKEAPGRPILFGTTEQFLRSFGVRSLDELPALGSSRVEEFREEAESEVREKLGV